MIGVKGEIRISKKAWWTSWAQLGRVDSGCWQILLDSKSSLAFVLPDMRKHLKLLQNSPSASAKLTIYNTCVHTPMGISISTYYSLGIKCISLLETAASKPNLCLLCPHGRYNFVCYTVLRWQQRQLRNLCKCSVFVFKKARRELSVPLPILQSSPPRVDPDRRAQRHWTFRFVLKFLQRSLRKRARKIANLSS